MKTLERAIEVKKLTLKEFEATLKDYQKAENTEEVICCHCGEIKHEEQQVVYSHLHGPFLP